MDSAEPELEIMSDQISDREIAEFAQQVLQEINADSVGVEQPKESRLRSGTSGLWILAVFLLGMTCMEGLRVLVPAGADIRGSDVIHRCGGP